MSMSVKLQAKEAPMGLSLPCVFLRD